MFAKLKGLSEMNNKLCGNESLKNGSNNLIKYFFSKNKIEYHNLNEIDNLKKEKKNKGFIIISNHTCITTDFLLILSKIDCFTITTKDLLKKFLYFSKLTNDQMVERCKLIEYQKKTDTTESNGDEIKSIILDKINNGNIIQLYPEGGMSGKKSLNSFKKGFLYLAYENNIPILPIIIDYKDNYYINTESETDRIAHHLKDTSGIDIHTLKFIYSEDYNTFEEYYDKVYNTMNDLYTELKK